MSGTRAAATFRWRLAIGAVLIAGGYTAWLIIPFVATSDLSRCQNGGDGFPWSNAAAYEAHRNWATGSTNGRLPQETFFQMVQPRFGAPLTSWSYSTPKCMRTASKRMLRLWLGGRLSEERTRAEMSRHR